MGKKYGPVCIIKERYFIESITFLWAFLSVGRFICQNFLKGRTVTLVGTLVTLCVNTIKFSLKKKLKLTCLPVRTFCIKLLLTLPTFSNSATLRQVQGVPKMTPVRLKSILLTYHFTYYHQSIAQYFDSIVKKNRRLFLGHLVQLRYSADKQDCLARRRVFKIYAYFVVL